MSEQSIVGKLEEPSVPAPAEETQSADEQTPLAEPIPKAPENEYYEVRASPGKGYGCFALQDLNPGTRILEDEPLLVVPIGHYMQADIEVEFEKLSDDQKKVYWSLASNHGQDPRQWPSHIHPNVCGRERQRIQEQHSARVANEASLVSIFQTNCMELGTGAAIFPHAARFNHNCTPSANFAWNSKIRKETVHIIRAVKKDEEITFSYCDMLHERMQRAYELKHYGFKCDCEACVEDTVGNNPESFAYKAAVLRFDIAQLEPEVESLKKIKLYMGEDDPRLPNQLLKLAKLYKEVGQYSIRLADVFVELALVYEQKGNMERSVNAARQALHITTHCHGEDSLDYEKYAGLFRRVDGKLKAQ